MHLMKSKDSKEDEDNSGNTRKWYHIDVETLPAKMCYFFVNMKEAAYKPYLILYFTSVGLSVTQAGIIAGFRLIGMLLGAPIWGMVDDRWKRPQVLISILCIISSAFMIQMPFVAAKLQPPTGTVPANSSQSEDLPFNTSCFSCNTSNTSFPNPLHTKTEAQICFWYHFVVSVVMMFFDGALIGLNDSAVVAILERGTRKLDFGWQRVFGAVGYGVGTLTTSLMIAFIPTPYPGLSTYWSMFFVYAFGSLCFAGSSILLFLRKQVKETKQAKKRLVVGAMTAMMRLNVLFFFSTCLVVGILLGLRTSFTFKLMAELGSPQILMGMTSVLGSIGSIVLFAFTTKLIHVLGGPMPTIGLAVFVYFVRFVVYGYARSPYLIFAIEVLHCFTFAPFVASAVMYVSMTSPKEILSTMYSIMNGIHYGAGSIVANWLGGFLYERWGGPWLFKASAVLALLWMIQIAIYVVREKCQTDQKKIESGPKTESGALIVSEMVSKC